MPRNFLRRRSRNRVGVSPLFRLGLTAYYPMNETATSGNVTAADATGNTSGLSSTNSVLSTTGRKRNGRNFGRSSSQWLWTTTNPVTMLSVDQTIALWVKPTGYDSSAVYGIISNDSYPTERGYALAIPAGQGSGSNFGLPYHFLFYTDGTSDTLNPWGGITGITSMTADVWHLICLRRSGNTLKISIDGVNGNDVTLTKALLANRVRFQIGRRYGTTSGSDYWNGAIDEVAVWDRALSDAEVTDLYNKGNGIDITTAPPLPYHAEAIAWRNTAVQNTGHVSVTTLAAVSKLCKAVDAAGLRDRFVRVSLCCGDDVAAAVTPLYRGTGPVGAAAQKGTTYDGNVGPFTLVDPSSNSSSGYWPSEGFRTTGGSYKYLETNVTISQMYEAAAEHDDCHMALWSASPSPSTEYGMGAFDDSGYNYGRGLVLERGYHDTALVFSSSGYVWDYFIEENNSSPSPTNGLHIGTIIGNTAAISYNGADVAGTSQNLQWPSAWASNDYTPIMACAYWYSYWGNDETMTDVYDPNQITRAYSFGKSLSATQRASWYTILEQFMTDIGRTH